MHPVDPEDFEWDQPAGPAADVRRVLAEATAADGRSPLDEAALLALGHGISGSTLFGRPEGFAWLHDGAIELVVAPSARRRGVGRSLAAELPSSGELTAWSHGDHPGAARLAAALGWDRVRDLWLMRRSLDEPMPIVIPAEDVAVRTFKPGTDEDEFLALNAEAFAGHPEQGSMTRADLDARMAQDWFEPAGFFLAADADSQRLLGFHWTKVHDGDPPHGEVYVLGVSPRAQGRRIGRLLTLVGLHHLRDHQLGEVVLYVEADNAAAVALYEGLGFTHAEADTDVRYRRA